MIINFIEQRARAVNIVLDEDERQIIKGTLERETYDQIAAKISLANGTIRDKGSHLWENLTTVFRQDLNELYGSHSAINKRKFSPIIRRIYDHFNLISSTMPTIYVERSTIETEACLANTNSSSLIRIKAPQKMGKSSLLKNILRNAERRGFNTVICDFGQFIKNTYENYNTLLNTFCLLMRKELGFDENETTELLNQAWTSPLDINVVTTNFVKDHVLGNISGHLVLALENFDNILETDSIRDNFCRLLRHWYDNSQRDIDSIWIKLHLIIIHSTDVYGRMDINFSPLAGVGEYFELKMFNHEQIQELFEQHQLILDDMEKKQLIDLLDGHPYLLTLAIKELERQNVTLENLIEEADTENGIFREHLRQILDVLNQNSDLREAYEIVVNSDTPVELLSLNCLSFKLYSLGLIKQEGDRVSPSNSLYRKYFKKMLELD